MTRLTSALFCLLLALPAAAQYDDSDPEMKQLLDTFFDLTPCGTEVSGLCPESLALLRGGGDRLASYLIRQLDRPDPEGPISHGTYLRLLGHTESDTAFLYLAKLVETRADAFASDAESEPMSFIWAIEGLGNTRDIRAMPIVIALIERFPQPGLRIPAVNAADRIQVKNGEQAEIKAALEALDAELATSRSAAAPGATDLERRVDAVLASPGRTSP